MKNKFRYFIPILMVVIIINLVNVIDASSSISVSKTTLTVGETASITVKESDSQGMVQGTVSSSGSVSVSTTQFAETTNSFTIIVTGKSAGTGSVTVKYKTEDLAGNTEGFEYATYNFTVKAKPTSNPNNNSGTSKPNNSGTSKPNNNSGSSSGGTSSSGSSSGGSNSGGNTNLDTESKPIVEDEKDEVLLIKSFKITSLDEKMNGEVLETISTVKLDYNYSYELPKNINKVDVKAEGIDDGVKIELQNEVEFKQDEDKVELTIRATKDDVVQDYKLTLSKPYTAKTSYDLDDNNYIIVDDDNIDDVMVELGFERVAYDEGNENESFVYVKDKARIQVMRLVGAESNGPTTFVMIDENNSNPKLVNMYVGANKDVLFVLPLSEEVSSEKIQGMSSEEVTLPIETIYTSGEKGIVIDTKAQGWKFNDGFVVSALNTNNDEGFYYINPEGNFVYAVVGFDVEDPTYKYATYALSGVILVGIITGLSVVLYKYSKSKKKTIINK